MPREEQQMKSLFQTIRDSLQKTPVWEEKELHREEVRGVFTIGVIAAILSVKLIIGETNVQVVGISVSTILYILALNWSIYAFLTALSLSEDGFNPNTDKKMIALLTIAKRVGRALFEWGGLIIFIIFVYILIVGLPSVLIFLVVLGLLYQFAIRPGKKKLGKKKTETDTPISD